MKATFHVSPIPEVKNQHRVAFESILSELAGNAAKEDAGTGDIAHSIDLLRSVGVQEDDGTADAASTAYRLIRVGAVNLSVGRLWEGHINALHLVKAHGSKDVQHHVRGLLSAGAFFGVWGADDVAPVVMNKDGTTLLGAKKFTSGLGVVTHAVITINSGPQVRLALVEVRDGTRSDASGWQMPGMKATASGRFDFAGMTVPSLGWIGGPGDYLTEPHFVGGVWRIAALQVGAAVGLIEAATAKLRAMDRMGAEAQKSRLADILMRAVAGCELVEKAAIQSNSATPDQAVALSIAARLLTETVALDTIRAVEQSLGLGHFDAGSDTGRMARDLSVYLRQAARDAFLMRFADHAFADENAIWGLVT